MPETILFSERSRQAQIVLALVVPFIFGAIVGVVLGASATAYWILSALAAIGGVLAGLEHPNPRSAAIRGLVIGAVYGIGLLLAHAVAGTDAEVSLGSFPPFVIVIDAIAGAILATIGGLITQARIRRSG
jgi:uncharacterized membrane protein (UPF0136 family)